MRYAQCLAEHVPKLHSRIYVHALLSFLNFDTCAPTLISLYNMDEVDVSAAMGISGFGKAKKKNKPTVNVKEFEKNKRQSEAGAPTSMDSICTDCCP